MTGINSSLKYIEIENSYFNHISQCISHYLIKKKKSSLGEHETQKIKLCHHLFILMLLQPCMNLFLLVTKNKHILKIVSNQSEDGPH